MAEETDEANEIIRKKQGAEGRSKMIGCRFSIVDDLLGPRRSVKCHDLIFDTVSNISN